jgi:c-di-GMP-binding flagellar brake protein YcgR
MKKRKPDDDRRQYRRFKVPNDAFAIVKNPRFKLGQITDMSLGGMSICYLDELISGGGSSTIDILLADNEFYIEGIPVSFVWHADCREMYTVNSSVMKKCGVRFGELTPAHESKLAVFVPGNDNGYAFNLRPSC